MRARTCLHTQAQTCACKNAYKRSFLDIFKFFSTRTHRKHVPTPPKVLGFHLNSSYNKTCAFTNLKIDQNGRSKEKLESGKNSPIWPLHPQKDGVGIYRSRKSPIQPYHSIPTGEMKHIGGEDVGTLLGLRCH